MYEREQKRKNRQLREKRMREKRKRRRRKKLLRALLILILILLLAFAAVGIFFLGKALLVDTEKESMKLPWSFGTVDIVLDAGHGGKDQGASSGDVLEKNITLEVTGKTKEILEKAGYKVGMVRDDDTFVALDERAEYANRKQAKVFVSIHCNSAEEEADGIETFYTEQKDEKSQNLAQILQKNVIEKTDARDREAKTANYTVIVRTDMPAALVEVGFLSDSKDCELLQQEDYQEKLAEGIADGIIEYLDTQTAE